MKHTSVDEFRDAFADENKGPSELTSYRAADIKNPYSYTDNGKIRKIMRAFLPSQFSYCPQIWVFSDRQLNNRIIHIHERALRIVYKDTLSDLNALPQEDSTRYRHRLITLHSRLAIIITYSHVFCSFHSLHYLLRPRSYCVFHMCRAQLLYSIHVKYGV